MKRRTLSLSTLVGGLMAFGFSAGAQADGHVAELLWERDNAAFASYDKILLKPLDLQDVKVLKPVWAQDDADDWVIEGEVSDDIQTMFDEIMSRELSGENGFTLVDEAGPGVMQIEVEFLSITPYVKPGTASGAGGMEISTLGSGDVHVSAELRDSVTGSVLSLIEGERQIGTEYRELSPENHQANLMATFSDWGQRLREYLIVKQAQ
ncbi:MAG: DUF3313 family protein [Pseudomonadota bacterium]